MLDDARSMYIFIHTLDTTLTNIAAFTKRASKKSQQNTWPCQLKNASTSHPVNLLFDLKQSVSLNFSFRCFIIIVWSCCSKMEWYKNVYRDVFGRTINTFTRSNYFVTLLAPNSIRSMNKICIIRRLAVLFFNTDSSVSTHEDWNKVLSLLLENVWPPTMKKQEVLAFIRWCYAFTHVWSTSRDMSSSWDSVIKMRAQG